MGQDNLRRFVGRAIDNKDLAADSSAFQPLLTPIDKLTDRNLLIHGRNDKAKLDRTRLCAGWNKVLDGFSHALTPRSSPSSNPPPPRLKSDATSSRAP